MNRVHENTRIHANDTTGRFCAWVQKLVGSVTLSAGTVIPTAKLR
jgi:hypothetical protein